MAKKIHVTRAQKLAAQSIAARNKKSGKAVPPAINKIANATARSTAEDATVRASRSS